MALQKAIPLPTGVDATYHRIVSAVADFERNQTTLNMQSYVSAQARLDGKSPVSSCSLTIEGMPNFDGDPRPWAYAQFKARDEWHGATDV